MNESFTPSGLSRVQGGAQPAIIVQRNLDACAAHWGMTMGDVTAAGPSAAPAAVQAALDAITTRTSIDLLSVTAATDPEVVMEENFARLNAAWATASPVDGGGGGSGPAVALVSLQKLSGGRGSDASVAATCPTPGTAIYVSSDRTVAKPWTLYTGAVSVPWGDYLYAYATASGMSDSGITSFRNYSSGYAPA